MSYLIATPEIVSAAATDLAGIARNLGAANSAAAASTTGVLPAALDEVSAEIAALFGAHGQAFQALSAQAAAFHKEFVQLLGAGANMYANAEANVVQTLTGAAATSAQGVNPLAPVFTNIEAAQIAYNAGLVSGELNFNAGLLSGELRLEQFIFNGQTVALNGAVNRAFNAFNLGLVGTGEQFVNGLSGALVAPSNLNSSLIHGSAAQVFNGGQIGGPLGAFDQTVVAGLDLVGIAFGQTPATGLENLLTGVETAQINYNTGLVMGELGLNATVLNFETGVDQALGGNFLNGALNRTFNAVNLALLNTPEQFINGLSGAQVPANFNSSLLHGSSAQVFNGGQIGGPLGVIDQSAVAVGDLVGIIVPSSPL